jgi:hypothetical protein
MKMDEIMDAIISLAENDQSIDDVAMSTWVSQGINRINVALNTNFPSSLSGSDVPAFDARYHEALVIFGVAKYRESDSAYSDAQYFMQQFENMVMKMQRDMEISPSYQTDYNYKQIVVTDATTFVYNLDIPSGSYFDDIVVYLNDAKVPTGFTIDSIKGTVTFTSVTLTVNDKITVKFENNSDLNAPPFQWWGTTGW